MLWYILGQHHRIVAWVAKCKSLQQHWHISSKGNMKIPSTNSRKHTCSLLFFKYIFIFFHHFQENKKPIKAIFCRVRRVDEFQRETDQEHLRRVESACREDSFFLFFIFKHRTFQACIDNLDINISVTSRPRNHQKLRAATPGPRSFFKRRLQHRNHHRHRHTPTKGRRVCVWRNALWGCFHHDNTNSSNKMAACFFHFILYFLASCRRRNLIFNTTEDDQHNPQTTKGNQKVLSLSLNSDSSRGRESTGRSCHSEQT